MATYWEQKEITHNIPMYNIDLPLVGYNEAILNIRGDEHLGLRGLDEDLMKSVIKTEQNKYRDRMLVLNTGDSIENAHKRSIGHNYDIEEPDPDIQLQRIQVLYEEIDKHLYGSKWKTLKQCNRRTTKHARKIGVVGNHEYRTRKETGIWLNNQIYSGKGTIDAGIHCLINLNLSNKKLKAKKSYRIYLSHRLSNSAAAISHATLLKNFQKKKADIDADIYVCGHYHKRFLDSDIKYNKDGTRKKIMYAINPAPCLLTEYAEWAQYSPIMNGIFTNIYLPVDGEPHGKI